MYKRTRIWFLAGLSGLASMSLAETPVVSDLSATIHSGQVFLVWKEAPVSSGVTFKVFLSDQPIDATTLPQAHLAGHHIEAASACDWWKDPASFDAEAVSDRSHGFVIDGKELDPAGGLFVHTVTEDDPDQMYFAVLPESGNEDPVPGVNSLKKPVTTSPALIQPIPLKDEVPRRDCARGKSLTLQLHGRGDGRNANDQANFLVFGDSRQGWREGLARKFVVEETEDGILISPMDRMWVGRPLLFSQDKRDHALTINTWWYGCNNLIYDSLRVEEGVMVNYTEEHLLYLVRWAQQYYGTDPARTYIQGNSMGGSGALSVGFHHPDVFATIFSSVPITSYTRCSSQDGKSNLWRLDGLCGFPCDEKVMTHEGIPLMERMNSERIALQYPGELPFLVIYNGRKDGSIPWVNNPSFYRALNNGRRGFVCYWNDQNHSMRKSGTVPDDMTNFYSMQPVIKLENSYPAFSNFSCNREPGNGERDNGDIEGWINRGLYWKDIEETENSWSIRIFLKGDFLPAECTVDLTPRRLTRFQIAPNETLLVNDRPLQADANGLFTIPSVLLKIGEPVVLQVRRMLNTVSSEQTMEIEARMFQNESGKTMPYRIYKPAGYDPSIQYPLVLCLHGRGGGGTDNKSKGIYAIDKLASAETQNLYPSFLITPQCPEGKQWVDTPGRNGSYSSYSLSAIPVSESMKLVLEIIEAVQKEFSIDPSRIYVTGQSMGGYGTWDIILRNPHLFAAAVPVCGAGDPSRSADINHLPIWAFHGGIDPIVPVAGSREMVEALQREGGKIKYTEYPGVGHESWVNAWKETTLIPWFFGQTNAVRERR